MGMTMKMVEAYLDSRDLKYRKLDDDCIRCGIGGLDHIGKMDITIFFDDNDRTVAVRAFNVCKVPAEKKPAIYKLCSDLNGRFRWVKFHVDESDDTITAEDDAVLEANTAGEEIFELMVRMTSIVDDAYPIFMKEIFA